MSVYLLTCTCPSTSHNALWSYPDRWWKPEVRAGRCFHVSQSAVWHETQSHCCLSVWDIFTSLLSDINKTNEILLILVFWGTRVVVLRGLFGPRVPGSGICSVLFQHTQWGRARPQTSVTISFHTDSNSSSLPTVCSPVTWPDPLQGSKPTNRGEDNRCFKYTRTTAVLASPDSTAFLGEHVKIQQQRPEEPGAQQKSAVSMSGLCCWLCLQWMAAVYLNRLRVFMSDVYSVEEPARLALLLRFTPPHFGLQELAK